MRDDHDDSSRLAGGGAGLLPSMIIPHTAERPHLVGRLFTCPRDPQLSSRAACMSQPSQFSCTRNSLLEGSDTAEILGSMIAWPNLHR
ncbi:hypothetical protein CBOM_07882 [Ceraceosorus bombacis]|uniref:Uncharacterized protein n=1 Tax=Ceraceosorus bombacis TaxID=401625 RepID=A0A0N7LA79_9BASI|nr:hypothetical protein CBOM_07882 [Ceraceosorus bombacis]